MNNKRLILLTICWISVITQGLYVTSFAEETNTEAEQHFEKANELRKTADYDAAVTEYKNVIKLSPNSRIAQDAQYWIGQSYFEAGQFDAALSAFEKILDEYPDTAIISSTKLMIDRAQQAKKNRSLFEAAEKGDVDRVKQLIAEGADINVKWADVNTREEEINTRLWHEDDTPLYYAARSEKMEIVKLLVEAGAEVNAGQWPPLYQAVDANNVIMVEYLLEHGAKIDDGSAWTALQEAPYAASLEIIEMLIAKGADVNAGPYTCTMYWTCGYNDCT